MSRTLATTNPSRTLDRLIKLGRLLPGEFRQVDQSCLRRLEATGSEVERSEVVLEVHVQPFAAGFLGVDGGSPNQLGSHAGMLVDRAHLGIEQEGMVVAIPCNVHEPNQQAVIVPSTNPAKAVPAAPVPPTGRCAPAVRLSERNQLLVLNLATPLVLETHVSMVAQDSPSRTATPRATTSRNVSPR